MAFAKGIDRRNENYKCIGISKRSTRFFAVHFPQFLTPIFHALQVKIEFAPSHELSVVFRPISLVDKGYNIIFIFKLFIASATQHMEVIGFQKNPKKWIFQTPAMVELLTDHVWTMKELMNWKVPIQ